MLKRGNKVWVPEEVNMLPVFKFLAAIIKQKLHEDG